MSRVPLAIPLVWTKPGFFFLPGARFRSKIGSDCLRNRGFIR